MTTIESIKKDINSLGYADKEEILNYLEEVITFGAVSKEITKTSRNPDSPRGKSARIAPMRKFQGMGNTKTSKNISVSPAEKHLRILPCPRSITAGMI